MKTEWDYTKLADAYLKRPDYADVAVDEMLTGMVLAPECYVADIGAGTAHLTRKLAQRKYKVTAVEPNDAMRAHGVRRTKAYENVVWVEGSGEKTGLDESRFDLVIFGSSFNVVDRALSLKETKRILKPKGWFACLWNHRDLNDSFQKKVEDVIASHIQDYQYGVRREDQSTVIRQSGFFKEAIKIEGKIHHVVPMDEWVEAWRSHSTLHRQAGDKFSAIIRAIEDVCRSDGRREINVPYVTRIWAAQLKT